MHWWKQHRQWCCKNSSGRNVVVMYWTSHMWIATAMILGTFGRALSWAPALSEVFLGVFISRWRNYSSEFIMSCSGWHLPQRNTPCHQETVPSIGCEPGTWGGNGNHSLLLLRQQPRVESSQDFPINPCTLLFTLENWYWCKYVLPGWGYSGGRVGVRRTITEIGSQIIFWIIYPLSIPGSLQDHNES